jgi:hypothetical protein
MAKSPNLPKYAFSAVHADMMRRLFTTSDSRITIEELKSHEYFADYKWDDPLCDLGIMRPRGNLFENEWIVCHIRGVEWRDSVYSYTITETYL